MSLRTEVQALTEEVRKLVDPDVDTIAGYSEEVRTLQRKVVDLEVEKSKKQEAFDRERREVEHMVGLERKRSEFETSSAKREAELAVREKNLGEERRLFEDRMKSVTKNLEERITYLQDHLVEKLMTAVTSAMPTVDLAFGDRNKGASKAGK